MTCSSAWSRCSMPSWRHSVPGIAVAGDGAGIGGATAAEARPDRGAAAAVQALASPSAARCRDAQTIRARGSRARERGRAFLDTLYRAGAAVPHARRRHHRLPLRGGDGRSRCATPADSAATGPNQMKAFLRCGMGPCQGRLCGLTVTELIAAGARHDSGRGRLLPPAPAGEADHARPSSPRCRRPKADRRRWCA